MSWDTSGGGGGEWDGGGGSTETFGDPSAHDHAYDGGEAVGEFGGGYSGGIDEPAGDFGGGYSGGNDGACFNCGEQGHSKADCSAPAKPRPCFNCGEEGHNKADCTNAAVAREFTGTCRLCELQGHRASDCPSAPPKLCKNCQEEGHSAVECQNPRKPLFIDIPDVLPELAWEEMKQASEERELDEFKEALDKYLKAVPETTYVQLEGAFRGNNFNIFIIAMEKELTSTYTLMDIQGNLDKKFAVSYRLSDKHQRPKEKEAWPATPEENMERLQDAGVPVDRGIPKCSNCDELGHISKSCPEEKVENADRAIVKCYNCEEVGHRVRDCPIERPDRFACRNCKKSGHSSKECPEPRSAEGVECKKCNEVGHFAKDCPLGGGSRTCRNCDAEDHISKDCPKPRDYTRIKCSNCQEMGHGKARCNKPHVDEDAVNDGENFGDGGGDFAAGGDYGGGEDAPFTDDCSASAPIAAGGWEG